MSHEPDPVTCRRPHVFSRECCSAASRFPYGSCTDCPISSTDALVLFRNQAFSTDSYGKPPRDLRIPGTIPLLLSCICVLIVFAHSIYYTISRKSSKNLSILYPFHVFRALALSELSFIPLFILLFCFFKESHSIFSCICIFTAMLFSKSRNKEGKKPLALVLFSDYNKAQELKRFRPL